MDNLDLSLIRTKSGQIEPGPHKRVAVKSVGDRGGESLKINLLP